MDKDSYSHGHLEEVEASENPLCQSKEAGVDEERACCGRIQDWASGELPIAQSCDEPYLSNSSNIRDIFEISQFFGMLSVNKCVNLGTAEYRTVC